MVTYSRGHFRSEQILRILYICWHIFHFIVESVNLYVDSVNSSFVTDWCIDNKKCKETKSNLWVLVGQQMPLRRLVLYTKTCFIHKNLLMHTPQMNLIIQGSTFKKKIYLPDFQNFLLDLLNLNQLPKPDKTDAVSWPDPYNIEEKFAQIYLPDWQFLTRLGPSVNGTYTALSSLVLVMVVWQWATIQTIADMWYIDPKCMLNSYLEGSHCPLTHWSLGDLKKS